MPQLDIFFYLPSVIYFFLIFFILLFYCHNIFLPKMAALLKIRQWERRFWPFPAILRIEVIHAWEVTDFMNDDWIPSYIAYRIFPIFYICPDEDEE